MFCCLKTPAALLSSITYILILSSLPSSLALPNPQLHQLARRQETQLQPREEEPLPAPNSASFTPQDTHFAGKETTCATVHYSVEEVALAAQAACYFYHEGMQAGMSPYPHIYYNYAGLNFGGVEGPYQEFPLTKGSPYNGGNPGADRIIINANCEYAGAVTHNGAAVHKGIVPCTGTK